MKVKMTLTNNQVAFEYAIYMMVASYFKKATCQNKMLESSMRVQFLEQKIEKQIKLEDRCLRFIEKSMIPLLPADLWEEEVKIHFEPSKDKKVTNILFVGKKYILAVHGIHSGDNAGIRYAIFTKPEKKAKRAKKQAARLKAA